jgi:hypothetical protein
MDQLVWSAARRLALLVGCSLTVVGALLVRDALRRRGVLVADVLAGSAAVLAIVAALALLRARGFFARPEPAPPVLGSPYRDNAHVAAEDPREPERNRAIRSALAALMALAVATAFAVAAAASR